MQKQCSKCKEVFENAEENFYKSSKLKSGFNSWCKKCESIKNSIKNKSEEIVKAAYIRNKIFREKAKAIIKPLLESKTCSHCNEEKEIIHFKTRPVNKDGYANQCKKCEYEICTDSRQAYVLKNWAKRLFLDAKAHSKYDFDIDEQFVSELYEKQNGKCFWFNVDLKPSNIAKYPWQPSLDRLDREKGYTKDNVVLACYSANIGRNTSDEATFSLFVEDLKKALSAKNNE
jgi:hypothetical protein